MWSWPWRQGSTDQNRSVPDRAVRFGPRTGPDQDRKKLRNPGPGRTRTKYFPKISDQVGPGLNIFGKSRTNSDQDQIFQKISDQLGPGPEYIWNLEPTRTRTGIYQSLRTNLDQNIRFLRIPHLFKMRNRMKVRSFAETAFILNAELGQNRGLF